MGRIRDLFKVKCPQCRSTRVREVDRFTLTHFIFYRCEACGLEWKVDGY